MKKIILLIAAVVVLLSISYAQEEVTATKEYIPLAKGNFWEYKVKLSEEEGNDTRMEIVRKTEEGRFEVESTAIGTKSAESAEWWIEGEFFYWKTPEGEKSISLRMLKLGGKKGDSWTDTINVSGEEVRSVTMTSTITAVEDVSTPAGTFKNCLKVSQTGGFAGRLEEQDIWFAKGVGVVKYKFAIEMLGLQTMTMTLMRYKIVGSPNSQQISEWLKESETVLLVEVTSVTDIKPEKEGEAVTRVKVAAKVEKPLKGESSQTELSIEMNVGSIKVGKYVLFFKKGEKGDMIVGEPVEATESNLKVIDEILNPPQFVDMISAASSVIAGKVVTCEDRETFKYYVVEIIKAFKGEKKEYIDVYRTEDLDLENGKIYIFALKAKEVGGRSYLEPTGKNAVVPHSEEIEKQIEGARK